MGIDVVAEDRVADGGQVQAQLMGATGQRGQREPDAMFVRANGLVLRLAWLARVRINFLARTVGPVLAERQVDSA